MKFKTFFWVIASAVFLVDVHAQKSQPLEDRVRRELAQMYYDDGPPIDQRLLGLKDREGVVEILLKLLAQYWDKRSGDREFLSARQCLFALRKFHVVRALPLVQRIIDSGDEDLRTDATMALGEIDAAGSREPLLKLLNDKYYPVRRAAAQALGSLDDAQIATEIEIQASRETDQSERTMFFGIANDIRRRLNDKPRQ